MQKQVSRRIFDK